MVSKLVDIAAFHLQMGYHVTVEVNLDNAETEMALKSFCNSEELRKVDCAVVCVLSHGKNTDTFITYYGEEMTVGEVITEKQLSVCEMA